MDLERRRPVDVLPDRSAATFAAWLAARPGIAVISRDRGGAYAEGGRQGAPDAMQVADRFHLAKNAGDALERVVQRHRAALRQAVAARQAESAPPPTDPPAEAPPVAAIGTAPTPSHRQRQRLYDAIVRLAAAGWSKAAIARQVGVHTVTIRAYLLAGGPPDLTARGPKPGACRGDHEAYLRERWRAGCHDAKALWGELREQGYRGSLRTVQRLVAGWRAPDEPRRGKRPANLPAAPLPPPHPPSPRRVRWWLLRPAEERAPAQATFLAALLTQCPEIAAAATLARDFLALLRARDPAALEAWLARSAASAVPEFRELATGLTQDRPAVEAALTTDWSNEYVAYCTSSPRSRPQAWLSSHAGSSVGGQKRQVPRSLYRSPRIRPARYQRQMVWGRTPAHRQFFGGQQARLAQPRVPVLQPVVVVELAHMRGRNGSPTKVR